MIGSNVSEGNKAPDAQVSFDALAKSIAYRVMNGPNEFTIVGVIKDWDRRKDLGKIHKPTLRQQFSVAKPTDASAAAS